MADPWRTFLDEVEALLRPVLEAAAPGAPFQLEAPPQGLADRAFPCFPLAKTLKKPPNTIAMELAATLATRLPSGLVARVESAGGYLNFHADRLAIARATLKEIRAAGAAFGKGPERRRRLILEHTSANPNGPLHVGRARNPIIGDTLARIFRQAGWQVEVQYYLDDMGKQVAALAWGLEHLDGATLPPAGREKPDHERVRFYQAAQDLTGKDTKTAEGIHDLVQRSEEGNAEILRRFEAAYRPVLDGMLESLKRIGVGFDAFIKESMFVLNGETAKVIERLNTTSLARQDEDGGRYLDLGGHGVHGRSQRFVYQRRDGTSLYPTRDVAYHLWKARRADRLVNILGEDHRLQSTQVRVALELLSSPRTPEVVFYSFVTLPEGKMSTRRGRVVYLDDLIDEAIDLALEEVTKRRGEELPEEERRKIAEAVGIGALRYNIVRVQAEKGIAFKWEEALNFEGASAPFIQYAYARCASILRKAGKLPTKVREELLTQKAEIDLLVAAARLPALVAEAAETTRPHLVAGFAQELASSLNAFYRDCPVLNAETPELRDLRLSIVEESKTVLGIALHLLGVPILETM